MDVELLEKFFRNQCTPEEVQQVLRWMSDPNEKDNTLRELEAYWNSLDTDIPEIAHDQQKILRLIQAKLPASSASDSKPNGRKTPFFTLTFLKVAAVIVITFLATFFFTQYFSQSDSSVSVELVTRENPAGQKSTFQLPDGSIVKLNAESSLVYPVVFTDTSRVLRLKGEAFFEVAEDLQRPFTVVAQGVATTALGTSFNVKAYPGEEASIALVSGKVQVEPANAVAANSQTLYLEPGESATYYQNADSLGITEFNLEDLAWREGTLIFHHASFAEVTRELERWYGVSFLIQGTPSQPWDVNGRFNNENLENVLLNLGYAERFDFAIDEKQVTITFK
ncbi:FecR family protein [Tunicatimonas pelagia]|uniref:FecR family protein n=1 Tax=Tunicatimonas pelagia TaxID=931531 RepID=UPI002665F903|nr:FecR family protein [Tunicatimonas pelagia]WKN45606.1 FecR domain-containing protein [Tunicatimonas pelagia]